MLCPGPYIEFRGAQGAPAARNLLLHTNGTQNKMKNGTLMAKFYKRASQKNSVFTFKMLPNALNKAYNFQKFKRLIEGTTLKKSEKTFFLFPFRSR